MAPRVYVLILLSLMPPINQMHINGLVKLKLLLEQWREVFTRR